MNKKGMIVVFSVCLVVVAGLIATIIVLASGTQGVGTSVSVLYVATDIEGTVSAKYSKVNKNTSAVISTTDMVTSSGSKTVSFLSTAPTTTSLLNPTESSIALTAEQDLIITYTFTAVETYYATLEYKDNSTTASNIEFSYALNDGAYNPKMSMPIEVTPDKSTTYSIKLRIANTARNANLSGSLNWALTKSGPNSPIEDSNVSINFVNNGGSVINNGTVSVQKSNDGTKFKIVGPTPIIDSSSTTSYLNGSFSDRTTTASGKVSSIDDLTNSNGAEFYYFCTNSAVVGSLSYNDPGKMYCTSTADSTLESWYDLPDSNTNLYTCFMTPNYTTETKYGGNDTTIIISNKVKNIPESAFSSDERITSVVIPQSVTKIGSCAFSSCDSLESVYMTQNVAMGYSSFCIATYTCTIYINCTNDLFSCSQAAFVTSDWGPYYKEHESISATEKIGSIEFVCNDGQIKQIGVFWIYDKDAPH